MAVAFCAQLCGMDFADRDSLSKKWSQFIIEKYATEDLPLNELQKFSVDQYLYDIPTISTWISKGLGKDQFSLQSAAAAYNADRVPLLLDPQGQGRMWASRCLALKSDSKIVLDKVKVLTMKYSDAKLETRIKESILNGFSLVIE